MIKVSTDDADILDKDVVFVDKVEVEYSQKGDSCQDDPDAAQGIKIKTENAGGGNFFVIETSRWAFNSFAEFKKLFDDFMSRQEIKKPRSNNGTD